MKNNSRQFVWFVGTAAISAALVAGCNQATDSSGNSEMDDLASTLGQTTQQPTTPQETPPPPAEPIAAAPAPAAPAEAADNETTMDPQTVSVVGKKQRRNQVEGPLRYYGAMANARVIAMDRAIGWQIKKSMDVYLATHDDRYPKDLDEFMREIIEPNMIELPELEHGQEFYYDPEDHELKIVEWVDAPADADASAE